MKLGIPYILIMFMVLFSILGHSQDVKHHYKWQVSTNYAYEQHDKRLYEWPQRDKLLNDHPEKWGTYWYGVVIQKVLLENEFFQLKAGLGYASELRTFKRPYDPRYMFKPRFWSDPILYTNRYKIKHLQVPVDYSIKLVKGIQINAQLLGDFNFFKRAGYKSEKYGFDGGISNFTFDFYSVAFFPGIQFSKGRISACADYRLFQLKKIDKVIMGPILFQSTIPPDPRLDDKYETYNPAHIRLTVSYAFGEKELKTRE